jgi:opacity protein-like surface antigen
MKALLIATAIVAVSAPAFAQERSLTDPRGYVTGLGGFSTSLGSSTGNTLFEGGLRIAPHVMVFGNLGHFASLEGDLQPTLDATAAALDANDGINVTGSGSVPATYGLGGVRLELPMGRHAVPYVLGGIGAAHLKPSPRFAYASGILPDGSTPDVGTDITTTLVSSSLFTAPAASTARMATLGGGVQIPVSNHWTADAGYRYGRIAADTTLNTAALNTNGMTFGFGYRF